MTVLAAALMLLAVGCDESTPVAGATSNAPTEALTTRRAGSSQGRGLVGEVAPDFTLPDPSNSQRSLGSLRGKIVVLEWLDPRCAEVRQLHSSQKMTQLIDEFPRERVEFLAIAPGAGITAESLQAFREEHRLSYPILRDASGAIARRYAAAQVPSYFVVDGEGRIRYQGAFDQATGGSEEGRPSLVKEAIVAVLAGSEPEESLTEARGCPVGGD